MDSYNIWGTTMLAANMTFYYQKIREKSPQNRFINKNF